MTSGEANPGRAVDRLRLLLHMLLDHLRTPALDEQVQRTLKHTDEVLEKRTEILEAERRRYLEAERRSYKQS